MNLKRRTLHYSLTEFVIRVVFVAIVFSNTFACFGQENESKGMYVNLFGGMGMFQSEVSNIGTSNFVPQTFQTLAPTGFGLSIGFLKNTYLDIAYSIQSLENEQSYVFGDSFGSGASGGTMIVRNNSFKLKQEIHLYKGLKIAPFFGVSFLHLAQPSQFKSDLKLHSKSMGSSYTNGVIESTFRDSVYHAVDYRTNRLTPLILGVDLKYAFNERLSCYFSYTYMFSQQNYSHLYVEYYRTDTPPQSANIYFSAKGHLMQLGISRRIFNLEKTK